MTVTEPSFCICELLAGSDFSAGSDYTWKAVQPPRLSGPLHTVAKIYFVFKNFSVNRTPHLSLL